MPDEGAALSSGYFLLRGTSSEIRFDLTIGGEVKAADEAPKVTVVRDNGEAIVTDEAADGSDGEYVLVLSPTQTARLDLLTATWIVKVAGADQTFTTHHEVVGDYLTGITAIRASLPTGATASDEGIILARTIAEQWLEDECNVAFRPRYAREDLDGTGGDSMLLGKPKLIVLRDVTVSGTSVDVAGVKAYPSGVIRSESFWPEGAQNVSIAYEHGFITPPARVSRAAIKLARHLIVENPSDYDERASSMSTEEAHYTFITPGMRGAITAIPEVNVVISRFEYREGIA